MDLDDPLGDEPDPFDMPIEEVGEPIDLSDTTARLDVRLRELLAHEGRLFTRGVTCPVKDRDDTTCTACPLSQAGTSHRLSPLCRIGRETENVLTRLAIENTRFEVETHDYSAR